VETWVKKGPRFGTERKHPLYKGKKRRPEKKIERGYNGRKEETSLTAALSSDKRRPEHENRGKDSGGEEKSDRWGTEVSEDFYRRSLNGPIILRNKKEEEKGGIAKGE